MTVSEFVDGLPKCELHVHIEGTLEPELTFALATRNRVALRHADEQAIRASYRFDSLASFLAVYYEGMSVLLHEEDFYDLALAYLTKAASQNVRYVEMFFDPQAHTSRGVAFGTVLSGLRRAIVDARRTLGITAELIMCFLRDLDAGYAMATLMESLTYKDWILGVGLDSDERANPPVKFAKVFARARAEGYFLTMHCDVDQPGTLDHLRQAIVEIGVDRIDHGSNVIGDHDLVRRLVDRGVGLTNCPISNGFVSPGMKAAEIALLGEAGVKVTINSDDPAYFGGYVVENLLAVQGALGLSMSDLVRLERNAFDIAWLPASARAEYLGELDAYERVSGAGRAAGYGPAL
jgi:adenosine deaminase